jgi:formamidase
MREQPRESPLKIDRIITLNRTIPLVEARDQGHNRWHADIPPIAHIAPGDVLAIDTRDGGDLQITRTSSNADDEAFDIDRIHPMTGPFFIDGAEPGDLLVVEILRIDPGAFGWTGVFPGGGALTHDDVKETLVVKWCIQDGVARSEQLPGIRIPSVPFVGVIGVAPSADRRQKIAERERDLSLRGGWVYSPTEKHAVPSSAGKEGLRTVAPREIGGNMDIKDVIAGSRVMLPVDVPGALLSIGDIHFAQGDGEAFATAIEMCGRVYFRCQLRKSEKVTWRPTYPVIETPPRSPVRDGRRYVMTTGLPLRPTGQNEYLDFRLSARAALEEMVGYLTAYRGYNRSQAHAIVAVAVDLRISIVTNAPNGLVSAALPLDIFENGTAVAF